MYHYQIDLITVRPLNGPLAHRVNCLQECLKWSILDLPLKRDPLALDQRPRALRIVHAHTGLTKLRYFLSFFAGLWHRPTPKSCQTEVGRGGESRVDWYGSSPYFFVQEIDLHLSFQAQQNGVLLLGAMEALQLCTRCKLTVPGSWFLFISAESHGSICKQFPVTNAKGKKRPPAFAVSLRRFGCVIW